MRIRTQINITMLLFGMILAIIATSTIFTNRQVEEALGQARIVDNIAQGASELIYLSNEYLLYGESQQLARWQSRFTSFSAELARLETGSPEQQSLIRNIQASRQMLEEVFGSAVSARKGRFHHQGMAFDLEFLQVSWSRMVIQAQSLISDASRLSQLLHSQANRLKRINIVGVFTMISVLGVYFLVNYILIQRRTLQSLATLQAGTAVIGSGNLEFAIAEKSHDEIGDLSRAFNRMAANLKDVTASKVELEREIAERKRVEESLRKAQGAAEEANRAKSEFLANMSHEIRTPMTVFLAALEHLLQIDNDPERRQLLEMAEQSGHRLRTLIDDILDFSRIEARRVDIEEQPFDLRSCVRDAVEMMRIKAGEKNLSLQMDISPDIPLLVCGDPNRLGQVLINLVANAVKFTPEGEVRVSVHSRWKTLEFAVSDTGIGIPEEKRDLLFQSFSQVDGSRTRKYGGTGLGLAISRGLVELMGGEMGMRNREGDGSVFFFTLPLKPAAEPDSAPEPSPAEDRPETLGLQLRGIRILVTEDEPMVREMILLTLARRGYRAETAETGREAVRKWEEGDFDIVLMDLQMPEMDGLQATRSIRIAEAENGRRTWIVGLTAHARGEIRETCLAAGMDRVLTKPVKMKDLFSALEARGCEEHVPITPSQKGSSPVF